MLGKGRGLLSVVLLMIVVWLGAYAAQYYTWTAPTQVTRTTYSITTAGFSTSVDTTGSENFGTHPTSTTSAVPASDTTGKNATIIINENYQIHFTVTDADAKNLDNYFDDLTVNICVYKRGLENAKPHDNLNLYVVTGGVGQQTNIDNSTTTLIPDNQWDPVITVDYTTKALRATGEIKVYLYAVEA